MHQDDPHPSRNDMSILILRSCDLRGQGGSRWSKFLGLGSVHTENLAEKGDEDVLGEIEPDDSPEWPDPE